MQALLKKHASKFRFLLVGGINTAIDFGVLFLLVAWGVDKIFGNYISTSIAFVFSFFANRSYTFKSTRAMQKQIVPFLVVTLTGLWLIQPLIIGPLTQLLGLSLNHSLALFISKLAATVVTLVWNYILYAKFVFKD